MEPTAPASTSALRRSAKIPIIELQDVSKVFLSDRMETRALNGIHLSVHEGDFVAISGPSGCGKSTLLSIMGLLDRPSAGLYRLKNDPVQDLSARARARLRNRLIGFVFQNFNLIGELNVFENVELPLIYRGLPQKERHTMALEALARVKMDHREHHLPSQLSGGQQQRVAVARALAGRPPLLLADEPTGNLDSTNGEAVIELLQELNEAGSTICMVTHNDAFNAMANRMIHLFDGRIVDDAVRA